MSNHIQISDVTPRIQYAADGSQTQFSYPFPIFVEDDLEVYTGDTKEISGYSVLGAGTSDGGSVTFDKPPASGVVVTLRRSLAIDRTTDFQQSGAFRAKDINDELDYLTAALQQVADGVGRAVRLSSTDEDTDLELPSKDERANKVLGFDASGDVIATSGSGRSGGGVTDHGQLTGLSDDDHGQYHTDARGDARYYTRTALDIGQLDGRYYTETEVDSQFAALGSAAALEVGTAVDDVVQLEDVGGGTPGLPAVDGSQLTGLSGGGVTRYTGTVAIPGTVPAGASVGFSITVTSAAVGDAVDVLLPDAYKTSTDLWILSAKVSATDTVIGRVGNTADTDATSLEGNLTAIVRDYT